MAASFQTEATDKEIEIIQRNGQVKNATTQMKRSLDDLSGRRELTQAGTLGVKKHKNSNEKFLGKPQQWI